MKKLIVPAVMTIVIIGSVLGILIGLSIINTYCDSVDAAIAFQKADKEEWADMALKYQSETMNLGYKLEDITHELQAMEEWKDNLLHSRNELQEEIVQWEECAKKRNEKVEILPVVPKSKPVTLVDVIQRVKPGVVHIMCPQWQGSGFVVGPNLIMTARHVVEGVENFEITTSEGHKLHATRAISSKDHDIALIYIDDLTCVLEKEQEIECKKVKHKIKLIILELGSIKDCQLGQEIITIGSPFGKINFNSVTLGIISGLDRDYDELNDSYYGEQDYGWSVAFQTDSPGHPGNSGGALFTTDGKVVGILVGGFSPSLIIAMPVDLFKEDITQIERMFIQDKYYFEEELDVAEEAWNYK